MYFSKDGKGKSEMQWKSLPEKVVTSFWKSCNEILEKGEKDGLVGIAVSYDMGWQKRGKGHNSLTGHGTAMGLVTGKVLSYATRYIHTLYLNTVKASVTKLLFKKEN